MKETKDQQQQQHRPRGQASSRGSEPPGGPSNHRYSNLIHDSDIFLTKLREFKPQSLGCLEARRKSSSTLIFPSPQQACLGPSKCPNYPHSVKPTTGYWIECHGPGPQAAKSVAAGDSARLTGLDEATAGDLQELTRELPGANRQLKQKPDELKLAFGDTLTASSRSLVLQPATPTAERIITTRHQREKQSAADDPGGQVFSREDLAWRRFSTDSSADSDAPNHQVLSARAAAELSTAADTGGLQAASESRKDSVNQESFQRNLMRKRLSKRTMTKDDIDLHKPRRTPNITITEPSFNQSIITYHSSLRTASAIGQESQSSDKSEVSVSDGAAGTASDEQIAPAEDPFRLGDTYQELGFSSADILLQGQPLADVSAHGESPDSGAGQRDSGSVLDESLTPEPGFQEFKLYKPQHRPSIIREDIDQELDGGGTPSKGDPDQAELYCGLSTTTFQKRPYQQSYQQPQGNVDQYSDGSLELISFEEENYEKHYYGREHWNYFTNDELLGPVMLSLKQEVNNQRDHFHVLLRTVSYTLHGTIPASTICADRYDREAIVRELSEIAKLKPPLMLGQLPSTPEELLKLDHIFIKTELKVGVIYIRAEQAESEEAILGNKEESPLFTEFLDLLGDRITLKGFDRYKGGLDTVHNLTGTESVYTMWRNIEIMFHVSTMLPHEENDPQKLQKKRHIGNDIVCVAFIEGDDTLFWPGCIKSYFLHTFIAVRTSLKPLKDDEKRKYSVSCVCRNEVQYAFKPYLVEQDEFFKSDYFREWLLVKIVNGERASYSAPKFARMQDRTRSQLLEDIITNLANHLVTGQIPKPYRRGSWRPLGHTRVSSPLEDSMKDYFEDYDQLAKDFCSAFCGPSRSMLCDVVFKVKDKDGSYKLVHGVRAILALRSRTFLEMLYGFVPPGAGSSGLQNQTSLRAIEMKALSGESSSFGKEAELTKDVLAKRGSVGADSSRRTGSSFLAAEKERRQSMLPNLSKSVTLKPNYLTVPSTSGAGGGGAGSGAGAGVSGTGGMIKNAFNRLVSGNWSGWSGNIKGYKGELMHIKVDQNKTKVDPNSLAICKEIAKIDADKLAQREFDIKEFSYDTFQQTIEYIHNGQCKLSYETIPGLICAAEHYDLPDLLHACFHHANTHMKLSAAPKMMNALYQNSCFYITAMQLLDSIYAYIDPHGQEFFSKEDYYELYESVVSSLLSRKTLQISELQKFQAMDGWTWHQVRKKRLLSGSQPAQASQVSVAKFSQTEQPTTSTSAPPEKERMFDTEEAEVEYRNLMLRLNKEVNIKLDKICNEDIVKIVLPTKVFSNDKIFKIMADASRTDY